MQIDFFSKELATIILGALPVFEVRGALPVAMFAYGFSPQKAYLLSVLGNLLPVLPVLFVLTKFSEFLMHRVYLINRFLTWLFERTRRKHGDHFESYRWMPLALFVFVAIPFPLTGAWSGILAALVFGIPFWRAVLAIMLGVITAGGLVLLLSAGAGKLF